MGKLLRILVVIIFVLSVAALTLAIMLFLKREVLKGRTQTLEQGLVKIARTLEAEAPTPPDEPVDYPQRDISDCRAEIIENPTRSEFWETYDSELESLDQDILDLGDRIRDLMSYYEIDPVTAKPKRDPVTGVRITDSPHTTAGVIEDVLERAKQQYDVLTATRQQLTQTRKELVDTITELNRRKGTLREKLAKIVELNTQIAQLNKTISDLRMQIEELNARIDSLENEITNLRQEKALLEEENEGLKIKVDELTGIVKDLRKQLNDLTSGRAVIAEGGGGTADISVDPGVKGTIASVDQKHQFTVINLEPAFVDELVASIKDGRLPSISLHVKRDNKFIAKLRISQLRQQDNLAIGDILVDWQQAPLEVGDTVFFQ